MAKIWIEVKKAVADCSPALVATAGKTGKPNVSAKGSFRVLDDEHVAFALIKSPQTLANLRENAQVAIICLDPKTRSGCRISGKPELFDSGPVFDLFSKEYAERKMEVICAVKVAVEDAYTF